MIRRAKTAQERAFEKLFNEFVRPLTLYALQFVKELSVAEDVVQDVFLYIYEKRETSPVDEHKDHYLYQLVRNRCLNRLEYQKIRKESNPIKGQITAQQENPFDLLAAIEFEHKYLLAVEKLPPRCKMVFELSRFNGRTNQEIANELGLSKRTVETFITQALKKLRRNLRRYLQMGLILICGEFFFHTCEKLFTCFYQDITNRILMHL